MRQWIQSGDLKTWYESKKKDCENRLPELIERLLWATIGDYSQIQKLTFLYGDASNSGGWDGQLETSCVLPFFPAGISGWEIGTGKRLAGKADDDYDKAFKNPQGLNQKDTTFVFVTPRPWKERSDWVLKKKKEAKWKDVRVIAREDIVQWLQHAPAVALWLAHNIKNIPLTGIMGIEYFWHYWSSPSTPEISSDLMIAGRNSKVKELHDWLDSKADVYEVSADHPDEAIAFLYSSIDQLSDDKRVRALSRCVVVDTPADMRACLDSYPDSSLIFVARPSCFDEAYTARKQGHHVYLLINQQDSSRPAVHALGRPDIDAVKSALHDMGIPQRKASQIARDFGRTLPALRRELYHGLSPEWAKLENAQYLLPACLMGAWDGTKEGDRKMMEQLSGKTYDDLSEHLKQFLNTNIEDAPLEKIGNVWMLRSPLDAWFLLGHHLDQACLDRFYDVAVSILSEVHPKYDLPPDQRYAAAIYNKNSSYSSWLRNGIARVLVLFTIYGDRAPDNLNLPSFSKRIISSIFDSSDGWEYWASIKDVMPILMEAAPDTLLEIIDKKLKDDAALFATLMKDDGGPFLGECNHSGLLWSLESAAWVPDYLTRSALLLLELAQIDEGGTWSNRPMGSLSLIFLPRIPQTYASPSIRLEVLDILKEKSPQKLWDILVSYFRGGAITESHQFSWRIERSARSALEPEHADFYREYMEGLWEIIDDLSVRNENLVFSLENFTDLPPEIKDKVLEVFLSKSVEDFSASQKKRVYYKARKLLSWLNNYGKDNDKKYLSSIKSLYERFTPADLLERYSWLFEIPFPDIPEPSLRSHKEKEEAIGKLRAVVVQDFLEELDVKSLLEFASTLDDQYLLGLFIAKAVSNNDQDLAFLDSMMSCPLNVDFFIRGYSKGRVEAVGVEWVKNNFTRLEKNGVTIRKLSLLFFGLDANIDTWNMIENYGESLMTAYWEQVGYPLVVNDSEACSYVVSKLLDVGNLNLALQVGGDPKINMSSALISRLLSDLLKADSIDKKFYIGTMDEFHISHLFRQLYENDDLPIEEMVRIELPYATLFNEIKRFSSNPLATHRYLQINPAFFVELVSYVYKRDDHAPKNDGLSEELLKNRADIARKVFDSWYILPGMDEKGSIDYDGLKEWIDEARRLCEEVCHVIGGDLQIGQFLSRSPSAEDGIWPAVPVRNLIEYLRNDTVDEHIAVGLYNSRGVVSWALGDGGKREEEEATKYEAMADELKIKWPRTASILRSLAGSYMRDAQQNYISDELRALRY